MKWLSGIVMAVLVGCAGTAYSATVSGGRDLSVTGVKTYTVTLKDASVQLSYYHEDLGIDGLWQGKGVVKIPEGSTVYIYTDSGLETKSGYREFQKWSLSPSTAAMARRSTRRNMRMKLFGVRCRRIMPKSPCRYGLRTNDGGGVFLPRCFLCGVGTELTSQNG